MSGKAPIHYLRANHRVWTPPCFIAWDTETRWVTEAEREIHTLRCWSLWLQDRRKPRKKPSDDMWAHGATAEDLADTITQYAKGRRTVWTYAHNQGFDLSVTRVIEHLLDLGWEINSLTIDDSSPWVRLGKGDTVLTMCDSWSILPRKLDYIGDELGIPKYMLPGNNASAEEWRRRCDADVYILGTAIRQLMDWWEANELGNWTVTGPSCGWNAMRHFPSPVKVLIRPDPEECKSDRAAIYGGVRYVWQAGKLPRGRYVQWDIERAYTTVCRDLPLPVERIARFASLPLDDWRLNCVRHGVIAQVTVRTDRPRYPVRWRNAVWYPVGTFTTTLAGPDIREARDRGELLSVGPGWLHRLGRFLWPWGRWIIDILSGVTPDAPPTALIACRGWARSVPGKWGQRGWVTKELGASPVQGWGHEEAWDHNAQTRASIVDFAGKRLIQSACAEGDNSYPGVLAYVESYVRCAFWELAEMMPPMSLICGDTDGIIVDSVAANIDGTIDLLGDKLSARPKGAWHEIEVFGPQHVAMDEGRRMAGIPASAQPTEEGKVSALLWPSLPWQASHGLPGAYVRPRRTYKIGGCYVPGWVLDSGAVKPIELASVMDTTNLMVPWPRARWSTPGRTLRDTQHRSLEAYRAT